MYGQGNFIPQFRQGPPPPNQHQYQQGLPPPPPPPLYQTGPPPPLANTSRPLPPPPGPPVYQHGPLPPPPPVQQGGPPPPPPPQPYMHLPPSSYASSTIAPPTQQNVQYPSSLPRVLPPPPSQGPAMFTPFLPPPPPSIGHGRPLPPPPSASFTPTPFVSNAYDPFEHAQPPSMPPPPPPPPPSSPPPLPPSPPPPTFSPDLSSASPTLSQSPEKVLAYDDKEIGPGRTSDDLPVSTDFQNGDGSKCDTSVVDSSLPSNGQSGMESSPPPEPAKFPDEYGKSNSLVRPPEIDSSVPSNSHINDGSHSPADSDMDMEDEAKNTDSLQVPFSMFDVKEQQHKTACSPEDPTGGDVSCGLSRNQPPELVKEKRDEAAERTNDCTFQVTRPITEDISQTRVSPAAASVSSKEVQDPFIRGGSPFRLIQDYASDDSSEADEGPSLEDGNPIKLIPATVISNKSLAEDEGTALDVNIDSANTSLAESGLTPLTNSGFASATSTPSRVPDISQETLKVVEPNVVGSEPLVAVAKSNDFKSDDHKHQTNMDPRYKDYVQGDDDIDTHRDEFDNEEERQGSSAPKVDEFGRLIREGVSDSDSDGQRYTGRHASRGRSRSRSPQDRWRKRSRSPWRRKDKRNRSTSWSPRKRRPRSRSPPAFKHTGEYGGEKTRRDRDQICFDFLRGRCYRGASCRYLHRGSAVDDMDRRYKGRQQPEEVSKDLMNSTVRGDYRFSVETYEITKVAAEKSVDVHDSCSEKDVKSVDMLSLDTCVGSTDVPQDVPMNERPDPDPALANGGPVLSVQHDQSPATTTFGEMGQSESQANALGQVNMQVQDAGEGSTVLQVNEVIEHPEGMDMPLVADSLLSQPTTSPESQHISGKASSGEPQSGERTANELSQPNAPFDQPADPNSVSLVEPVDQTLPVETSSGQLSSVDRYSNMILLSEPSHVNQTDPCEVATNHTFPSEAIATRPPSALPENQPSELPLPPPPPPPLRQVGNAQVLQQPRDYNLQSGATNVLNQPASVEALSNVSWNSLPPPPPPPPAYQHGLPSTSVMHNAAFRPLQFHQNTMPLVRPYSHGEPSYSKAVDFQPRTLPFTEEFHLPPYHAEVVGAKPMITGNIQNQSFGAPNYVRDQQFTRSVMPDGNLYPPRLSHDAHVHSHPQLREEHRLPLQVPNSVQSFLPLPNQRFDSRFAGTSSFAQERMQSFADGTVLPRSFPGDDYANPLRTNLSFTQQQQSTFGPQWSVADGFSSRMDPSRNTDLSTRRYPTSFLDSQSSHQAVIEGPKISTSVHYNPYASTFDQQPGSSRFHSSFRQEVETTPGSRYNSFSMNQASVGDNSVGGFGSRLAASPDTNRSRGKTLPMLSGTLQVHSGEINNPAVSHEPYSQGFASSQPKLVREPTGDDQYDPFDFIEPSSKTSRKLEHIEGDTNADAVNKSTTARSINESGTSLRVSNSQGPINAVEDNQKQGEFTAVATSPENDEFGETAIDAEFGGEDTGSPDNPVEIENTAAGDIEIDQVQSKGKSKRSKDSRSMKLFKVALADFVKEILKPSWRQGNMSKEAFKTIVKKTVDKVSGAMKNHQIPKSQAKINQYVESSQRKLTKLVTGYVDKYVKT